MSLLQQSFDFNGAAMRARFGISVRHKVGDEMEAPDPERARVLTTTQQAKME